MYCSEFYEYLWHQIFAWSLLKGNIFGVQQKHSYKLYGFCRTTLSCFWCTSISVCDTDLISDHYSPIWNSWWVNMWWSVVSHLSCHTSLALWQELYQLSWLLSEIFGLHVPLKFTSSRHFEWLKESQKWSIWHFLFSLKFFLCTVVVSMNKVMPMIIFVSMASVIFDVIIFRPSENS